MRQTLVRTMGGGFAVALALTLGACSKSEQLEDKIAEVFEDDNVSGVEVTCPDDVDANEGDVVECAAEGNFGIDAERIIIEITFTADNELQITSITAAE